MANSQIRAKGVGKDAVRHDLDGTPGLDSDLQQGEVQEMEAGQAAIQDTQQAQTQVQAAAQPRAALPAQGMAAPDPVQFAGQKIGGSLDGAGAAPLTERLSFSNWLPLLRRLATSPTSSGLLQRSFMARMQQEMNRPTGTKTALIRQRDFDNSLEQLHGDR